MWAGKGGGGIWGGEKGWDGMVWDGMEQDRTARDGMGPPRMRWCGACCDMMRYDMILDGLDGMSWDGEV